MSNLARVWNRKLPTAHESKAPSSVQFSENNIVVGRDNNVILELVQITVDLSVLATITFIAPSPLPPGSHFAQAVYDTKRSTLWIAPFARGSLYGFKYNLKGLRPGKVADLPPAFDEYAEFPLEPVLSLVIGQSSAEEDADFFFATPNGFSQAHIDKASCEALARSSEMIPAIKDTKSPVRQSMPVNGDMEGIKKTAKAVAGNKTPKKQAAAVTVKEEPLTDSERGALVSTPSKALAPKTQQDKEAEKDLAKLDAAGSDELAKALKRVSCRIPSIGVHDAELIRARPRAHCRITSSSFSVIS